MHDENYDRNDSRCMKYKSYIETLESYRERYEAPNESRFEPSDEYLERAIDVIYSFFKNEVGYAPTWLINALSMKLGKLGSNKKHTIDDRLFNSNFIDLLVQRGSSVTQAIKLLSALRGNKVVTEGALREGRETYKEFKSTYPEKCNHDLARAGWIISEMLEFKYKTTPKGTEAAFQKSVGAFEQLWQEIFDLVVVAHPVIKEHDSAYPDLFGHIPERLLEKNLSPIDFFFRHPDDCAENLPHRKRALREYIYSCHYFLNHFDPTSQMQSSSTEPDWDKLFKAFLINVAE